MKKKPSKSVEEKSDAEALGKGVALHGDCLDLLPKMEKGSVDLAFADPPFNEDYPYDLYVDRKEADEYINWAGDWMREIHRVLKPNGTFWLMISDTFGSELDVMAKSIGFRRRREVIWYFTFGVNEKNNFTRSHVKLLYYVKDPKDFTFNANDPAVRIPSARQVIYKDKRANGKGRLPDDGWFYFKSQIDQLIEPGQDTWSHSRIAGTFKERKPGQTCQTPEEIMHRIIRACSNPGDTVIDPFCGSGATALAARRLGRNFWTCDISQDYIRKVNDAIGN